jgi:hypothetical protein
MSPLYHLLLLYTTFSLLVLLSSSVSLLLYLSPSFIYKLCLSLSLYHLFFLCTTFSLHLLLSSSASLFLSFRPLSLPPNLMYSLCPLFIIYSSCIYLFLSLFLYVSLFLPFRFPFFPSNSRVQFMFHLYKLLLLYSTLSPLYFFLPLSLFFYVSLSLIYTLCISRSSTLPVCNSFSLSPSVFLCLSFTISKSLSHLQIMFPLYHLFFLCTTLSLSLFLSLSVSLVPLSSTNYIPSLSSTLPV